MKIYINPGHGGTDSGAVGIGGRQEKDDTLRYASAVTDKLSTAGHEVKLERDGDYYISVTDIAKKPMPGAQTCLSPSTAILAVARVLNALWYQAQAKSHTGWRRLSRMRLWRSGSATGA